MKCSTCGERFPLQGGQGESEAPGCFLFIAGAFLLVSLGGDFLGGWIVALPLLLIAGFVGIQVLVAWDVHRQPGRASCPSCGAALKVKLWSR